MNCVKDWCCCVSRNQLRGKKKKLAKYEFLVVKYDFVAIFVEFVISFGFVEHVD